MVATTVRRSVLRIVTIFTAIHAEDVGVVMFSVMRQRSEIHTVLVT